MYESFENGCLLVVSVKVYVQVGRWRSGMMLFNRVVALAVSFAFAAAYRPSTDAVLQQPKDKFKGNKTKIAAHGVVSLYACCPGVNSTKPCNQSRGNRCRRSMGSVDSWI